MYPAPALSVVDDPLQIELFPVIAGEGLARTVNVRDALPVQPAQFVTVTVYVPAVLIQMDRVVAPVDQI